MSIKFVFINVFYIKSTTYTIRSNITNCFGIESCKNYKSDQKPSFRQLYLPTSERNNLKGLTFVEKLVLIVFNGHLQKTIQLYMKIEASEFKTTAKLLERSVTEAIVNF